MTLILKLEGIFMKKIVTCLVLSVGLSAVNAIAETDDEVVYSTEAYCLLSLAGAEQSYLTAYARKLGMTPSRSVCNNFKQIAEESTPKEWNYAGGRPYPGSAIRLSKSQIELLKASKTSN
ncbi:hypothetical protein GCM10010919_30140 [Alishewanella longhuensis]|uniref:DUF3718 domain-containing protein n=2 Tax=Alishewanella longhuensis TaxID=1091037 RepID=A0ABQ3L1L8_9ALTE|nr:hypothetical protein GCM10010919_30140 [Alishewanella longhuensis]